MRQVVRAALPLGIGIVYDPFAGNARRRRRRGNGYLSIGTDLTGYYALGRGGAAPLSCH